MLLNFITVFISGYLSVFLLGFQSRLVNHGNFAWAAGCSFSIAFFQATLWHNLMKENAGWDTTLAYALAGAMAITSAMWVHKKFFIKEKDDDGNKQVQREGETGGAKAQSYSPRLKIT